MDDEVANDKAARLVLALELLSDDFQDTIKAGLARRRVRPGNELVDVLADNNGETCDPILQNMLVGAQRWRNQTGSTWIASRSSAVRRQAKRLGASIAKKPSPSPDSGAPSTRLVTSSIAALDIQELSVAEDAMALQSAGSACCTTAG